MSVIYRLPADLTDKVPHDALVDIIDLMLSQPGYVTEVDVEDTLSGVAAEVIYAGPVTDEMGAIVDQRPDCYIFGRRGYAIVVVL